jgi:hypothetical protein
MKNRFKPAVIVSYGSFMSVILSKKSSPGDGMWGRGVKGGVIGW